MTNRALKIFILLAAVMTGGCFNTEQEYEQLVSENKTLAAELLAVEDENEILTRALNNIKQEEENLTNLLQVSRSLVPGVLNADGTTLPPLRTLDVPAGGDDLWVEPTVPVAANVPVTASATDGDSSTSGGGAGKIYVTQPGDVLSSIALKHNTTTARLLELNPHLRNRRDYMLWAKDKIRVP